MKVESVIESHWKNIVFSLIASAIIILSVFAFFPSSQTQPSAVTPSIPLSNVTVNVSVEPLVHWPTVSSSAQTNSTNYSGALIQLFPVYHPFTNGPSYLNYSNITAMATGWLNHTYSGKFKLPLAMYPLVKQWRAYFGHATVGETSFIVIITYFYTHNSTSKIAYSVTTTAPYRPFGISLKTGGLINVSDHPVLNSNFHAMVPDKDLNYPSTPIYSNYSELANNTSILIPTKNSATGGYSPMGIGGGGDYWVWRVSYYKQFTHSQIPISFLNETKSGLSSEVTDSITMGSTQFSTEFSMAQTTFSSSERSYSVGTSPVWISGFYVGGSGVTTFPNNYNKTYRDGVVTVLGNATVVQYQWTEVNSWNQVMKKADYYKANVFISSLDEAYDQFHLNETHAGFVNLAKYTNTTFKDLPLQERYQVAFGIYFNGTDSSALFGNANTISDNTTLQVNSQESWYDIYSSIRATTSNLWGEIDAYLGLAAAVIGVALVFAAIPFGASVAAPAAMAAFLGLGTAIAGFLLSGVISVSSTTFMYSGYIQNTGNEISPGGSVVISNWYTMDNIEVNGGTYQFPSNYAIVT
ncbi:MAG: hypothetical protein M1162_04625 [Candidatus Thermoplasmatota archaeon]|nr:hypothetical protein [Candidatus Thermoplasmatota archaeon]